MKRGYRVKKLSDRQYRVHLDDIKKYTKNIKSEESPIKSD